MRLRRWLWLLLVLAVPVPYFLAQPAWDPTALVVALAIRLTAAAVEDGGEMTRVFAKLVVSQAVVYLLVTYIVARLATRLVRRVSPDAERPLAISAAICAAAVALVLGARTVWPPEQALSSVPGAVLDTGRPFPPRDGREPCAERSALRRPLFGDLHIHTTFSFDAASQDTRNRPADAYRFARGEPLGLQPYDAEGRALRTVQLARPLDFAAVTDHAEFFGELDICRTASLPGHDSPMCGILRSWPQISLMLLGADYMSAASPVRYGFCGPDAAGCREAARGPWREVQEAAEGAYDRSPACRFTTFVGYEWTLSPDSRNLHRNVLFRNPTVPALPASSVDAHTPGELWRRLRAECNDAATGCEALTIPHNSNLSGGLMFLETDDRGQPIDAAWARERAFFEPLAEVMQHKGASECRRDGGTTDEECDFEQLPYDRFGGKMRAEMRYAPEASNFLRHALKQGLLVERALGANPFKYGLIGSTDTHIAAGGLVDEPGHPGHGGAGMPSGSGAAAATLSDDVEFNPGGLAVLWAEENSREALWQAMRRREAYATSGPRMVVRFFGGWGYPRDLCAATDLVGAGYAGGVPMGGDLPPRPAQPSAPTFVLSALRDPGTPGRPGTALQRLQIVKGWLDATSGGGRLEEAVYDVGGDGDNGAGVDLATCTPRGEGADSLCTVWTDPSFDPAQPAFYYARVLENPTCRWHVHECNAQRVDCSRDVPPGLAACCDAGLAKTVQERAWTSPIWYRPPGAPAA